MFFALSTLSPGLGALNFAKCFAEFKIVSLKRDIKLHHEWKLIVIGFCTGYVCFFMICYGFQIAVYDGLKASGYSDWQININIIYAPGLMLSYNVSLAFISSLYVGK